MHHFGFDQARLLCCGSGAQSRRRPLRIARFQTQSHMEIASDDTIEWGDRQLRLRVSESLLRRLQSPSLRLRTDPKTGCRVRIADLHTTEPQQSIPVRPLTRCEPSRGLPGKSLPNSLERRSPIRALHFASMQGIGPPGNFVQPRL